MSATAKELDGLRTWRTRLLIIVGAGQGLQYLAAPDRSLIAPAYSALQPIGAAGWRVIGALTLVYAALLIWNRSRPAGHIAGATVYLALMFASAVNGYWPSFSILAAGLNCGEFWFWLRHRGS